MEKFSKNVSEDATVFVEGYLWLSIKSDSSGEGESSACGDCSLLTKRKLVRERNCEGLCSLEAERICTLSLLELKRKDSHTDKVASMDSLVALGNDCLDTKKIGTLCSPIS